MGYGTIGIETFSMNNSSYLFYNVSKDQASGFYLNRVILETDLFGNEIDTLIIKIDSNNLWGTTKVLDDINGFIFSGSIGYVNHLDSYLIFTDSNFNKTTQIIYGDTVGSTYTFQSIDDACRLANCRNMMFSGEEYDTNTTSNSDLIILKTDSIGNKIWKKNYSYKLNNRGWFIESTPDGGAIIGGNSFNGNTLQGSVRSYDATVLKVDSAGNEQWHKVWGNPSLNDFWAVVANSDDGNYLLGTCFAIQDTIMNDYNDYADKVINIIKVDTAGNEIWNKNYDSPKKMREISRLFSLPNGNIISSGHYRDLSNPQHFTSWILMLNSNGDSLWYHEYWHSMSKDAENIINDIKPTPDGGFICCGEFSDGLNGIPQSLWVLKLDSTGWYYGMGFGTSTPLSPLRKFKVFPNPTSDFITVDISDFTPYKNLSLHLTNTELKELEVIPVERNAKSKRIDLQNYPTGVYFIRLQSGVEILGVEKVVVQ